MHQYLVFAAARGVGGQTDAFFGAVGVYALDESDGADGYEIVGVVGLGVVFFDDVRDETQVVFDEHIARLDIALEPEVHIFALLGGRQRPGERTG